jgi:hypothetical protein
MFVVFEVHIILEPYQILFGHDDIYVLGSIETKSVLVCTYMRKYRVVSLLNIKCNIIHLVLMFVIFKVHIILEPHDILFEHDDIHVVGSVKPIC